MTNYFAKKNIAFFLISFIGIAYIVFLASLTLQVWPEFETQVLLVSSAIRIQCDIPQLLSSGIQVANVLMGGLVILLWSKVLVSVIHVLQNIVRTNRYLSSLKVSPIANNIFIVHSKKVDAFSAGVLKPRIYISEALFKNFDKQELNSVIQHEMYHCQSADPLRKLVADLIKGALPYFPLKASIFANYEVLSELAADNYAQNKVESKKSVVSALSKMLDLNNPGLNITGFGLRNDRIHILLGQENFKSRQFFSFVIGVAAIVFVNAFLISTTNIVSSCKETVSDIHTVLMSSEIESQSSICSFITNSEVRNTYQSIPVRESTLRI